MSPNKKKGRKERKDARYKKKRYFVNRLNMVSSRVDVVEIPIENGQ